MPLPELVEGNVPVKVIEEKIKSFVKPRERISKAK
jgi:hypothetical protein